MTKLTTLRTKQEVIDFVNSLTPEEAQELRDQMQKDDLIEYGLRRNGIVIKMQDGPIKFEAVLFSEEGVNALDEWDTE